MRLPFLGRRSGEPPDLRRDLLGDIAGPRRKAAHALYAKLIGDPRLAKEEVELLDDLPTGWVAQDAIFLHVAETVGAVVMIDWADGADEILSAVGQCLMALGKAPIGASDAQWIQRYVAHAWRERGDAVGLAYGPLAQCLQARGLRALLIQTWSDCYRVALPPVELAGRWAGLALSEAMTVEDPSWAFEPYLRDSRFAAFLAPRA